MHGKSNNMIHAGILQQSESKRFYMFFYLRKTLNDQKVFQKFQIKDSVLKSINYYIKIISLFHKN